MASCAIFSGQSYLGSSNFTDIPRAGEYIEYFDAAGQLAIIYIVQSVVHTPNRSDFNAYIGVQDSGHNQALLTNLQAMGELSSKI
jgi:hypothetical protein